ncbi:Uncharacterised protein [Vibrio cholerae]|nr:Uncharacterised protein [Vibrio cholerae]CSB34881.1 Uncharacterised protein [Vibrio cholerae]
MAQRLTTTAGLVILRRIHANHRGAFRKSIAFISRNAQSSCAMDKFSRNTRAPYRNPLQRLRQLGSLFHHLNQRHQ